MSKKLSLHLSLLKERCEVSNGLLRRPVKKGYSGWLSKPKGLTKTKSPHGKKLQAIRA